jgi:hypothetical protein
LLKEPDVQRTYTQTVLNIVKEDLSSSKMLWWLIPPKKLEFMIHTNYIPRTSIFELNLLNEFNYLNEFN